MSQTNVTIDRLKKICRTCLSTNNKLKSFNSNEDLQAMLRKWTSIKPDEDDLLPKQICVICISKLNIVHNFVQTSSRAECDLKQAIKDKNQTLFNHLQLMIEASDSNSEDGSNYDEDAVSDDGSDSFAFSLPDDDLFECEDHKLKIEGVVEAKDEVSASEQQEDGVCSGFQIVNVESVPEEATASTDECNEVQEVPENTNRENVASCLAFRGFNREEINEANSHLEKFTETIQTEISVEKPFFDSIKYKCYLCENKLNLKCDKTDLKTLEFSTLSDDAHVLCKKRIKVLQKIIKEFYLKQDELNSLNNSWQKLFLQRAENINVQRVVEQPPTNPVIQNPTKPHEIGYRRDGQVHLGHLTWIPETDFDAVMRNSLGPHKFLINMAITLFGAETLAKSTITGSSKNGVRKEPLNAIRMCALKSSLKFYMKICNVPDYYQKQIWKNFNTILARKIVQISTEYKKRCLEANPDNLNNKMAKN